MLSLYNIIQLCIIDYLQLLTFILDNYCINIKKKQKERIKIYL